MRYILLFCFLICAFQKSFSNDNNRWQTIQRGEPVLNGTMRVSALDSLNFVVSRTYGQVFPPYTYIEITKDYGNTWDTIYYKSKINKAKETIHDIRYIDRNTIIALYGKGTLMKTTDCGDTWSFIPITDGSNLNSGFKLDAYGDTLIVSYLSENCAYSYDLGETWEVKSIDDSIYTNDCYEEPTQGRVKLLSDGTLLSSKTYSVKYECSPYINLVTKNTVYVQSTDWGDTWEKIFLAEANGILDIFESDNEVYHVGYCTSFLDSVGIYNDEGVVTHKEARGQIQHYIYSINNNNFDTVAHLPTTFFSLQKNENVLYGLSISNVYYSTDKGQSWKTINSVLNDTLTSIEDMAIPNRNYGMILLARRILRLENTTDVADQNTKESKITIYPNPLESDSKLNINLGIKKSGMYSYLIHDLSGKLIVATDLGYLSSQINNTAIHISNNIVSGTYLLTFKLGNQRIGTQRLIIK